ncbi:class I SAM-dependent methyltransferase [Ectothiorhodospiraceae bacterium WFHF3C12]|nr:class I SAM-dependent methyltransferase [Ectothiorhodospiraceae bacterium WFHF3C12]
MTGATQEKTAIEAADPSAVEGFEGRIVNALNEAGMLLMMSLGHRLGLFNILADGHAVNSASLAAESGCNERYVREWLGAMSVAGVLEIDPESGTYRLPPEHAALITAHGEANLAVYAQFIGLLGGVEDDVLGCFRRGGGVPYERFARFHEVMAEDSGQTVLPVLFDAILPLVDGLPKRLEQGIDVLDAGCGRGKALMAMAARYPRSRFLGYDLSREAIDWASEQARLAGLDNVRFEVRDLGDFDRTADPGRFDLVTTFDAIHDQANPLGLLKGIRRSLKPGGVYLAQDIHGSSHHHEDREHPMGAFLYAVSTMHCMTVSLAQGGEGLGTMWGRERAHAYFARAGFGRVEVRQLEHDVQNDYWILRP